MALARSWVVPQQTIESTSNDQVTHAVPVGNPGYQANLDSLSVPNIVTAPASSASVFVSAFTPNTASVATVVQNTLGYDAMFIGFVQVTPTSTGVLSASVATFQVGVGPTNPPPLTSVVTGYTTGATVPNVIPLPAYVPSNYYYGYFASQGNGASVNASLTVLATPV